MKLPVPNRVVRSLLTPPERSSFKPTPPWAPSNPLRWRDSDIRTKMAVVRLRQRRCVGREGKRPKVGLLAGPGGSDNWPGMAAFCGVPAADQERKKNVPNARTGGGKLTRREHSFRWASLNAIRDALPGLVHKHRGASSFPLAQVPRDT
jgi:hypothetical protein